ncbi:FKBP-type peptidyl-prolyl cis-trans isomerase [Arcticibacter tournemirensis]
MKRFLLLVMLFAVAFSSCKKDEGNDYNPEEQLKKDEQIIKDFVAANNLQEVEREENGIYYIITEPGTGTVTYTANTKVKVKYTGRLLNGTVFDSGTTEFTLGRVIAGWQLGVPLIQKGGKIRLLIPSGYAYGPYQNGPIPANSVLDFDIELLDVTN